MTQQSTLDYRSSTLAVANESDELFYGLSATAWLRIAVVTALMLATFRFNLLRLWLKTNPFSGEPNWRHAICVPLIGLYYLFVHRDELLETRAYTAWSGLGILIFGILLFAYGIYPGQNDFIKDFGMVVALFGVVAFMCGWQVMKIAWFPIVFLVCAIPWPELVYSFVASPLQHLAAKVAVHTLLLSNVDAHNFGTKIIISAKGNVWRTLNVAEACAGLRSLMTFISVAAAIAFLSARPLWQKIIVTFSAIPIAIFCNVMRVTGQGLLDHYWSQELSEGFAHQFVGIVMLVPGFFMILFVGWLLDVVFIEVVDDREARQKRATVLKPTKPVEWTTPRNTPAENPTGPAVAEVAAAPKAALKPIAPKIAPAAQTVVAKTSPAAPAVKPAAAAAPVVRTVAASPAVTPKPATAGVPRPALRPGATPAIKAPSAATTPPVKPAVTSAPAIKRPTPAVSPSAGLKAPVAPPAVARVVPTVQPVKPAAPPTQSTPVTFAPKAPAIQEGR